jgi:transcriptional regulator with XRE-family HTH domain
MHQVYDASTSPVNDARTTQAKIIYRRAVIQDPLHKAEVGRRLKEAREAADMTQDAVGRSFDPVISKGTVSGWERGANYPDLNTLSRLVKLYKTTADAILFGGAALSPRIIDLAHRLESIEDPTLRRYTFANVESMIVNAEENRGRMRLASPGASGLSDQASVEAETPNWQRGPASGTAGG